MGLTALGRIAVLALLALVLAGCAAGAPAPIAPSEADEVAQPADTVAVDPNAPTPTPVMLSDAPTSVPTAAPPTPTPPPEPTVKAADPGAVGGETEAAELAVAVAEPAAAGRVEFAQGAPSTAAIAVDGAQPSDLPAPVAVADRAGEDPDPPAQSGARPPAPAAPTDGRSLLVEGGSNGRPEVALTFDAGADRGYAEAILDLLRDEGIVATFGMTGSWAEQHPDLIQRMVDEGHQLINHTWSHKSLTGVNGGLPPMTYEELAEELARTEQVVRDLTGYELKPYFRPPYGDYDATTLEWLHALGYPFTVMWTCDSQGWRGWGADRILDYCTQTLPEDDIILMHVGASAAGDYEALPLLIAFYRQSGYAFVTAEQMLQP